MNSVVAVLVAHDHTWCYWVGILRKKEAGEHHGDYVS